MALSGFLRRNGRLLLLAVSLSLPAGTLPWGGVGAQGVPSQSAPAVVRVDSIEVVGNYRVSTVTILGTLGFEVGSEVTYRDIQRSIKILYATEQFEDIQVWARGSEGEPVVLVVEVKEFPAVRRLAIQGLQRINEKTVRDTTGLQPNRPYSPAKVARAKAFIRAELGKKGVPFARIEERMVEVEGERGRVDLFLDVTEGNRVTLAQIEIRGNDFLKDGEILDALKTSKEGFWWFQSGRYDADLVQKDLEESIPKLYRSRGFLDLRVLGDTLIVDPETGKARLEVALEEGPRYRLAEFRVEGNRRFSTDEVQRFFRLEEGGLFRTLGLGRREGEERRPVFNGVAFDDAAQRLRQAYNDEGYIWAQIEPWVEVLEERAQDGSRLLRAGWRIVENNPAYVNRVSIAGNEYTHERVIREKIFILPGDVYSQSRLISSYQSIASLGFFETPLPQPDIEPDPTTGDVNITFHVKEKQTGSINFGSAVGGGTGLSGFLGYDQPNLFGQAKEGHLRWDFGRYINSFTFSYSDPALFESQVSGTLSIFNARDRFFQFRTGRRKRVGFSLQFGFPVPWSLRTRLFAGYSLSRTEYRLFQDVDDTSLFGLPPGTQSTLSLGVTRSSLNHPLFPTAGSRLSWSTEFNGGVLGGDGDFLRHLADASWYVPVGRLGGRQPGSRPVQLTLGLTVRAGAVFGNVERFPFDRFWMGGVQFGQQLRGYDETSITPLGYYPEGSRDLADIQRLGNAYLSATAEYAVRLNDNISLSLFMDAGNLWADPRHMDPSRLYRGAGIGIQLVTPFGPLGLDYAYGFDKSRPGWQFHFRMGPGF